MSGRFLVGLDAGGGAGRCLVLDTESGARTLAFRAWSFPAAPGTAGLGLDADLESIWALLCEATRAALERAGAGAGAEDVAGIAATSMRFGVVVLDADGRPLYAGPNKDGRAAGEAFAMAASHGEEIGRVTGLWPAPILAAPRVQWLLANRPGARDEARSVLSLGDWLTWRLCGALATDPSQASCTGVFDLVQGRWSDEWIEKLGLPRAIWPEVRSSGSLAGALGSEASADLGIAAGTPVAIGGGDTPCGLLGVGALEPGDVAVIAGTSAPVEIVLDTPRIDPELRLWSGRHVSPDRWVLESNAGAVGEALEWLARMLYAQAPAPVAALLAEASRSEPGAAGAMSTFGVQIQNARALDLPLGDLTLSHMPSARDPAARRHLARALVEGAAYGLRANLEQLVGDAGGADSRGAALKLGGGLSRSAVFAQLLADVTGRPVATSATPESSALGAALCAGAAAGTFASLAEGARAFARPAHSYTPDDRVSRAYTELYSEWCALRSAREGSDGVAVGAATRALLREQRRAVPKAAGGVRPRILVTAALDGESLERLRALGDVRYQSFREKMRLLSGASLVEALQGVNVFITEVDVVDVDSVRRLPDLRVVASCRGDAVNVDVPGMTALGVPVLNAPGRNADAVADLTVASLLMLARKLPEATAFLRQPGIEAGDMGKMGQAFGALQGRELWRKTVGLVGLGAVGRGVARRLLPFGARVLVSDPFVSPEDASLAGASAVTLDELLRESDFVSLHAPVTDKTRGLISAEALARMKPGACLVNTARAALVDEQALAAALESGQLAGAAVDVFSVEPPGSDHPLLRLPNLIATPHVGGNTVEVASHQGHIIAGDLLRMLRGERPLHGLNPEALQGFDWTAPRPEPDERALEALARRAEGAGPAVSDLQRDRAAPARSPEAAVPSSAPAETIAAVEAIMTAFTAALAADPALAEFAKGQDVTLHFSLSDLPCACWLRLRDGAVSSAVGAPDEPADVQLRMRAYVFDGMFTGAVNAMEKAMSGDLSFTGDASKAMTLQQIQRDLNRAYRAARAEAGDPGDLESLPEPGAAGARKAVPVAAGDLREELIAVVNELYSTQLITATGGNVSARIPDEDEIWITPSQMFKGDLRPEILVRIDLALGQPLDPDALSPSSERLMHCAAYRARAEAKAVIHAHAPNATILVNADLPFLPISTEAAFFGDIPRIPFIMPGTPELADAISQALESSWAVLMQNHGILVAGRSLRRAADMAEIIERSAEIIVGCYSVGKVPPVLPDDVVRKLREMGDLVA